MLYIRADGNAEIGTGHVMRCLSIACAARSEGIQCVFIVADKNMAPLLKEQGFRYICLNSVWNDLNRETEQMEQLICKERVRFLLVDSYFVAPEYLRRLHQLTHVVYIDDLNSFTYPWSTLINYNLHADQMYASDQYTNTRLLLGPKYAPLREEFQDIPRRTIRSEVKEILVTTGGSDPLNIAGKLVEKAKQHPGPADVNFHIVAGRFNQHLPMLEQLAAEYPGVIIHRNVQRMSELMLTCDIAVSAGGSTLYELCACGIPTICFAWADNQLDNIASFGKNRMTSVGDLRPDMNKGIERIISAVMQLFPADIRQEQAAYLRRLVDGQGALRIAMTLFHS